MEQRAVQAPTSHPQFLAQDRKKRAVDAFLRSGIFILIPFIAYLAFNIVFPLWVYVLCLIAARVSYTKAGENWIGAKRAAQGAKGEEEIAKVLEQLPKTWTIEQSVRLDRLGDIDFLVQSPKGNYFVLEVKAHKGKIAWNGRYLCKLVDGCGIPFEKDFIAQTLSQATTIKELRHLNFVTPVVVFSQARLTMHDRIHRNVHVLQADELIDFLLAQ